MSFECTSDIASDSDILKELVENVEGDMKEINGTIKINYDFLAIAHQYNYPTETLPTLTFSQVSSAEKFLIDWDISNEPDGVFQTISKSGESNPILTKEINNNKFSIGERRDLEQLIEYGQGIEFETQTIMEWFKINYLNATRTMILKDFNKYDLYASVDGRVDDIEGTYTGHSTTVLGGEVGTQQRQETAMGRPQISRPVKQVKQVKKPLKKDKGSTY